MTLTCQRCLTVFEGARGTRHCSPICAAPIVTIATRNPNPYNVIYADAAWRKLSRDTREQANYQCQMPVDENGNYHPNGQYDCDRYADTTDHIIEVTTVDDLLRLDPNNCRAACRQCNSAKAARNTNRKRSLTKDEQ